MKMNIKVFAVSLGALLLTLTPAMVSARTIYFLVGVRHIYRIGPDRDLYLPQREEIEKTYADGVAADEATYQQHVSGGADPSSEAQARDEDLALLADDRDKSLGAIFDLRDDIRQSHPELQIQGDGPYQVMGIDYHMRGPVMVFDDCSVYAPWPGYVVVGAPYGGWVYGRVYQPGVFFNLYIGWRHDYVALGSPIFYGGFYGHAGYVPFHAGVFVGGPAVYRSYVRPGGAYFARSGGFNHVNARGFNRSVPSGFSRPGSSHGSFSRPNGGGYSHSNGAPNGMRGQSRGSFGRPATGGYSHSQGATRTGGFNRSAPASGTRRSPSQHNNVGGFGNSMPTSESHRTTTQRNNAGSFGNSMPTSDSRRNTSPSRFGGYSHSGSSASSSGRSASSGGSSSRGNSSSGGRGHGGSGNRKGHGN